MIPDRRTMGAIAFADELSAELIERARAILADRRHRSACLGHDIFGEFAWDMLLALAIESGATQGFDIADLCKAVGASQSTGVRWIAVLESRGLVERFHRTGSREEKLVRLSDAGQREMARCLSSLPSLGRL